VAPGDWSPILLCIKKSMIRTKRKEKDFEAKRITNTKPTLDISEYAGKYSDPLFGKVEVTVPKTVC